MFLRTTSSKWSAIQFERGGAARPAAWGYAEDGRYIIAVFDQLDEATLVPVTAYEVPEPR
jgi:hypothetical protein